MRLSLEAPQHRLLDVHVHCLSLPGPLASRILSKTREGPVLCPLKTQLYWPREAGEPKPQTQADGTLMRGVGVMSFP